MKILLGATGAINTVNLPHYVRELTHRGHEVRVVLTPAAECFLPASVLRATTGVEVFTDRDFLVAMHPQHLALAKWCETLAVAPLTANSLAKLAVGLADNLLLATALARRPAVVAPCMNIASYRHPAVQGHLGALAGWGTLVLGPCPGRAGQGEEVLRMAGPRDLRRAVEGGLSPLRMVGGLATLARHQPAEPDQRPLASGPVGLERPRLLED